MSWAKDILVKLDVLLLAVAMVLWPNLTGTPLNVRTALLVAGLFIVARLLGGVREMESAAPEKEKREFVEDPGVVLEIAKLTGYEAVRRFGPYIGKWMTISGRFEGIAETLDRDAIHLSLLLSDGRRINLRFGMEHEARLRALRAGEGVSAVGRIEHRYFVFTMESCELVRLNRYAKIRGGQVGNLPHCTVEYRL
jgi:hypothetical protein